VTSDPVPDHVWHESITTQESIITSSQYFVLCNDVQSQILDMAYTVHISIAYTVSLVFYTLHGNFYKLNTVKIFNF